jgi:hypothetical protein
LRLIPTVCSRLAVSGRDVARPREARLRRGRPRVLGCCPASPPEPAAVRSRRHTPAASECRFPRSTGGRSGARTSSPATEADRALWWTARGGRDPAGFLSRGRVVQPPSTTASASTTRHSASSTRSCKPRHAKRRFNRNPPGSARSPVPEMTRRHQSAQRDDDPASPHPHQRTAHHGTTKSPGVGRSRYFPHLRHVWYRMPPPSRCVCQR